jgi:hypothetical protein
VAVGMVKTNVTTPTRKRGQLASTRGDDLDTRSIGRVRGKTTTIGQSYILSGRADSNP